MLIEHVRSCSNIDVNEVFRFRNPTDQALPDNEIEKSDTSESIEDELHQRFVEDIWSIHFPISEEMDFED